MTSLQDNKEEHEKFDTTTSSNHYNRNDKPELHELEEQQGYPTTVVGYINKSDFIVWTIIPAFGILFCLIHAEQEHLWQWTGDTAKDAQSLKAKVVTSVISTVIGGCVVAILMKTIVALSFTLLKYRGAHFSQLVTLIGGYSPSYIPMLTAGRGWFSILMIILALIVSVVTKQLAVVSMGVGYYTTNKTMLSHTTDYTTCGGIFSGDQISGTGAVLSLNTLNTIMNPNVTHSNEYYDRGIPASLQGISNFTRVLPYANVSCVEFQSNRSSFPLYTPIITNKNTWGATVTVPLRDESSAIILSWVNCTISAGRATAISSCNNTLCQTQRTSDITPYDTTNTTNGLPQLLFKVINMLTPDGSIYRNPLLAWIKGGDIAGTYTINNAIPGESFEVVQNRTEILATVISRIICDVDYGNVLNITTPILSQFQTDGYYMYQVLWKWPFWLIACFIFVLWIVCMVVLWMTPESRIMSVEWFVSQYISRNRLSYLSGTQLVQAHNGSIFQVVDQNPDEKIGSIVVTKVELHKDARNDRVLHNRIYQ